ncbi:MAG: DUF4912 domain-containing protein [Terrimicrobiaceae bacterium]|nr:DUF4912 domain-containing protein [Terrimicrobiaceae bacterium]
MPPKPRPSKSKGKGFTLRPLPDESNGSSSRESHDESPAVREPFDDLGHLPHGYGVDTIFLIAQEPHWLFTYWDIDIARHPGGAAFLRCHLNDGTLEREIEVPFETRNWYVPVERSATDYFVEIGFYRGEAWNLIARSVAVTTPPEGMATSEDFDYATVPFHLSFQRLLDHLENARQSGEDLLATVSRLQQKGDFSAFGAEGIPDLLTDDQRELLRAMLGIELLTELSSGGQSPPEIERRIRAYLEEKLSSGGASEFLNSFRETAGLFSGGAFSSESAPASWEIAAFSSWAAGALTSWTSSGGALASWSGAAGLIRESVGSSGELSAASWTAALGASWAQAAIASWSQAGAASWLQGVQSSWAQAALASWGSAGISSWFASAAVTSWSGASETLSSFGAGRGFFMNVNAEVIFYGGTDPRATVTIDGNPIPLNPDGTFRYHFIFPNADYQIPVTAQSPDGVETRSVTLRFSRATGKAGLVTDTAQPPLGEPMGREKH